MGPLHSTLQSVQHWLPNLRGDLQSSPPPMFYKASEPSPPQNMYVSRLGLTVEALSDLPPLLPSRAPFSLSLSFGFNCYCPNRSSSCVAIYAPRESCSLSVFGLSFPWTFYRALSTCYTPSVCFCCSYFCDEEIRGRTGVHGEGHRVDPSLRGM